MKDRAPAGPGIYLRDDAPAVISSLLDGALGPQASHADRAAFLRLSYSTYWRAITSGKRFKADNRTVFNLLRPFPDLDFDDLFEFEGREPAVAKVAA